MREKQRQEERKNPPLKQPDLSEQCVLVITEQPGHPVPISEIKLPESTEKNVKSKANWRGYR